MSVITDVLDSDRYQAWVNATIPEVALRTWPRVTLQANGGNRRSRAARINALKRGIENLPWELPAGMRLTLVGCEYSETHGWLQASYFTYTIDREVKR
jgi:hypothetical protein